MRRWVLLLLILFFTAAALVQTSTPQSNVTSSPSASELNDTTIFGRSTHPTLSTPKPTANDTLNNTSLASQSTIAPSSTSWPGFTNPSTVDNSKSQVTCSCRAGDASVGLSAITLFVVLVVLAVVLRMSVKFMKINRMIMGRAAVPKQISADDILSSNTIMAAKLQSHSTAPASGGANECPKSAGRVSMTNAYRLSCSSSLAGQVDPAPYTSASKVGASNVNRVSVASRQSEHDGRAMYDDADVKLGLDGTPLPDLHGDMEYSYVDTLPKRSSKSIETDKDPLPTPASAVVYGERRTRYRVSRTKSDPRPLQLSKRVREFKAKSWRFRSRARTPDEGKSPFADLKLPIAKPRKPEKPVKPKKDTVPATTAQGKTGCSSEGGTYVECI